MKRDGACISLWQQAMPEFTPREYQSEKKSFDVIIVGGGITGITTGLLLQKAGKSCLVAEAHNLCFGTTGGTTAHLNTLMDTPYNTVEKDFGLSGSRLLAVAVREALDLVKQQVADYQIDCGYEEKDGYLYSQNAQQTGELEAILEATRRAGVDAEFTGSIPVPLPFEKAIVIRNQAQFHPSRYVYALARQFEESGGVLLQHCPVINLEEGEELTVHTGRGAFTARQLIYATHIPPGINLLHFRCAPYRSYALAATLKEGAYPDGLAYDMYDPYHYYRTQDIDGKKYLVAGGDDHKTGHEENTEAPFTSLEAHVRHYFPVEEIVSKWSSQYFEPTDGLPYIGHLPGHSENVYVATGYGGNGITYSHVAALLLTGLLTTGDSPYKELFAPGRVKPVAGFSSFIKEAADVVKEFFGKRLSQEELHAFADLAPGEGRVVKYDGESIALYKEENGRLHAVNPVCTHAKCLVDWNRAEKSWDCPCHGSRFSPDGEVLTGPARQGLEKIDLGGASE
ncbi:FAD-dependent oxidoreductase [Paraflavisolibacter sp. H34]|uniref:FAD-dependent oxidoreductase n=1 Tax=Huijunlia imazamoxiresistens TaxID=3127457 RepID=UPI00301B1259